MICGAGVNIIKVSLSTSYITIITHNTYITNIIIHYLQYQYYLV